MIKLFKLKSYTISIYSKNRHKNTVFRTRFSYPANKDVTCSL